jgi:hypothetical protein
MVVEKHDDLWQNNQLYINMLHRYIGSGYPQILLTGLNNKSILTIVLPHAIRAKSPAETAYAGEKTQALQEHKT